MTGRIEPKDLDWDGIGGLDFQSPTLDWKILRHMATGIRIQHGSGVPLIAESTRMPTAW